MRFCAGGGVVGVVVADGGGEDVVGDGVVVTMLLSSAECWAFADATIASQLMSTCGSGAKFF